MSLTLEKPKTPRVHVQVIDPETKKSRCLTVYNATPTDVLARIKRAFQSPPAHSIPSSN